MSFVQEQQQVLEDLSSEERAALKAHEQVLRDIYGVTGTHWSRYRFVLELRTATAREQARHRAQQPVSCPLAS